MNDSFAKRIKNSKRIQSLPSSWIVPKEYWDSYYNHFTLRIRSLSDFICIIGKLNEVYESAYYAGKPVFRGHSDASSNYKLMPVIGRKWPVWGDDENHMVTEILTLRPEEFTGITSNFDLLSKMQHFGLPTRLLDFTYNPLIALYFACCSEKRADSRVVCTFDTTDESTQSLIENICSMYQYTDYNAISLDSIIDGVTHLRKYGLHTMDPLMAKPKYSNERIKHQAAVFMVFPNAIYDYRSQMVVKGREKGDEQEYLIRFELTDNENKRLEFVRNEPNIYKDSFYVNSETLRRLFAYYKGQFDDFCPEKGIDIPEKYHFLFKNRFSVLNEIQELSEATISNSFISILIEAKDRKKIIHDLETIGIDKAFVFPELEYTAEKIKNRFFNERRKG